MEISVCLCPFNEDTDTDTDTDMLFQQECAHIQACVTKEQKKLDRAQTYVIMHRCEACDGSYI